MDLAREIQTVRVGGESTIFEYSWDEYFYPPKNQEK